MGTDLAKKTGYNYDCFHSINVPSEWGQVPFPTEEGSLPNVSIQLMSPASGDSTVSSDKEEVKEFPFN